MTGRLGKKGQTELVRTVTVIGSSVAAGVDGQAAIVLNTKESGPLAFLVTLESCAALRRDIADAETFLRQNPNKSKN
jgi:hypothetical protein